MWNKTVTRVKAEESWGEPVSCGVTTERILFSYKNNKAWTEYELKFT